MWLNFFILHGILHMHSMRVLVDGVGVLGYPNDPMYNKQTKYLSAIKIPDAWQRLQKPRVKRSEVGVAVIDTGVNCDYPDLAKNCIEGYNVIDNNTDTHDREHHGTEVAGIVGAVVNNSVGIAGVMDLVKLMPVYSGARVTGQSLIKSVDYVIRHKEEKNIKIILMAVSSSTLDKLLNSKIKEATNAGILVVVTAGNERKNITKDKRYPCALTIHLDGVVCVTATQGTKMQLEIASNVGTYVDIAAPGADIWTTSTDTPYKKVSGTSAAAPIIAGVAAMLYSLAPRLSPGDVKKILKDTSKPGVKDRFGEKKLRLGRVDADKAVAKLIP
ncbi:hypothetical protein FOL47_001617 [Perkinsus chesapeaki]|uniref:subtilisin n=1 Tax=Perkinsus chesapeaki TaxID=330153 RepID=A0A7J6N0M8_PERCH|nr:hypothetical protein FOL47_001617 [Perkinsus chesapeaki]